MTATRIWPRGGLRRPLAAGDRRQRRDCWHHRVARTDESRRCDASVAVLRLLAHCLVDGAQTAHAVRRAHQSDMALLSMLRAVLRLNRGGLLEEYRHSAHDFACEFSLTPSHLRAE
jgi:hypothetical protein